VFRVLLALFPAVMWAGNWKEFRFGPFEVLTEGNDKEARETLNYLEQLRTAAGSLLGAQELASVWPIRIVVVQGKRAQVHPTLKLARDAWVASISSITPETTISVVKVLLDSWPGHIPPNIERGLLSLLSTLAVNGTRVTLGAPPAQKDRDWSRAHMLAVDPAYSGKLRVLLGNLGRGVERDVAFSNAFQKSPDEVERELDRYIEAGQFGTTPALGKPINAQRQFIPKELDDNAGMLVLADVLLAHAPAAAVAAYQTLLEKNPDSIDALEGLGMIDAESGRNQQALERLAHARSARALVIRAGITKDASEKKATLAAAAKANPKWAEPQRQLAAIETHPAQKLAALRAVAQIEPRDPSNWMALAEAQEANNQFAEAGKSWTAAERAIDDPTARARIRTARTASEDRRVQQQIAARDEARRKTEQELQDLRNKALLEIRRAEARANEGKPVIDPKTLDEYKEGPQATKLTGTLQRVDCMGGQARLHVASGKQVIRILVPAADKVEITGGGERSLTCGVQKSARSVTVHYTPKNDAKQGTAGEAVTIEFR
jgi:hypothetical protein